MAAGRVSPAPVSAVMRTKVLSCLGISNSTRDAVNGVNMTKVSIQCVIGRFILVMIQCVIIVICIGPGRYLVSHSKVTIMNATAARTVTA